MRTYTLVAIALAFVVGAGALLYADRTLAQATAQMIGPSQTMGPSGQMPMSSMMMQMQQQMGQMTVRLQAMRGRLDKINPNLLTPAEREMYEYLKLLQAHMETMQMWIGNAQGVMRQMPAPRR